MTWQTLFVRAKWILWDMCSMRSTRITLGRAAAAMVITAITDNTNICVKRWKTNSVRRENLWINITNTHTGRKRKNRPLI